MSNWIVRCANPRCRYVCDDSEWIAKPTNDPLVSHTHCPKCDCRSYYKAKPKEIARLAADKESEREAAHAEGGSGFSASAN